MPSNHNSRQWVVSYWCVPCAYDAARFQAVAESLAQTQGVRAMAPHLTLGATLSREPNVSALLKSLNALVLTPLEIASTEVFTKSLFVRFQPSPAILAARKALMRLPSFRAGRNFDPHISLCYGEPACGSSERTDVLALLKTPIRFDRLISMRISVPVESHTDMAKWSVLRTYITAPGGERNFELWPECPP